MQVNDYSIRSLRTFCAVVENSGFGGAQEILGVSQSVVSTHIKDLELKLGFTLCQRGRSGFVLTEKGKAVYHEAKDFLKSLEITEANLGALRRALKGQLRVGVVDCVADDPNLPIPRAIRRFCSKGHDVRLTLDIGTPDHLGKALQIGDIHVALGPFPVRQQNITYTPVYIEEHGLYCGRDHPLFDRPAETVTFDDVASSAMTVRPYMQHAKLANLPQANATAFASYMEAQALLIRSGCFLGFLPIHFADRFIQRGQLRHIDWLDIKWRSQYYIAVPAAPSKLVREFVSDLKTELKA
ncbi:MAG: LysR family transcriptional regulator [Rhodobacterales bacterium]|nr:LysR family transcriptional regulator [Rhodobacterales bacterium]